MINGYMLASFATGIAFTLAVLLAKAEQGRARAFWVSAAVYSLVLLGLALAAANGVLS